MDSTGDAAAKCRRSLSGLAAALGAIAAGECFVFVSAWRMCGTPAWGLAYMFWFSILLAAPAALGLIGFVIGFYLPMKRNRALAVFAACIIVAALAGVVLNHHVGDCRMGF